MFMGRYSPMNLWSAHVHRSNHPVLDPVGTLSGSVLELHGVENGSAHQLRWTFEHVSHVARPVTVGGTTSERMTQLPVVGQIDTYLDGELAKGNIGGMQPTHGGIVMHENPAAPAARPNCILEGTSSHLETPNEYLKRYSDIVRENRKQELTSAINLILPRVIGFEILTGENGESYLSGVTTDGKQLPLHDLGGGVVRLCRLLLSFFASRDGILLADVMTSDLERTISPRAVRWIRRSSKRRPLISTGDGARNRLVKRRAVSERSSEEYFRNSVRCPWCRMTMRSRWRVSAV